MAAVLYFVVVFHLTNLYAAEHHGVEEFILLNGGIYTAIFWVGQILIGGIVPLFLLFHTSTRDSFTMIGFAAFLIIVGGFATIYTVTIGGQAFPLVLFPGKEVTSTFYDGAINLYQPTAPEIALGLSGVAMSMFIVAFAVKVLRFLPKSLADEYFKDIKE